MPDSGVGYEDTAIPGNTFTFVAIMEEGALQNRATSHYKKAEKFSGGGKTHADCYLIRTFTPGFS